ncbi:MAG TPA: hypothetical protein VF752_02190 [Thermoleophilaceae bacterium]
MQLFNRKSELERMLEKLTDPLEATSKLTFDMPSGGAGKALKVGLISAGGLAGLTAASAAISSLRRKSEGASGDS